ncbi:PKD domain containing protein [Anaeromyxobacter dehalogenans 2CP-1]|uniref:PKD domain containing protein n=1 Tax=Anaeromyxobacter dehalogenans (strain ATCC BAA-258 / DSM 21875 / 2CP-1) TaxID=455488 RepID=B8JFD3_ANAD2|nr:PKD domain-containing protein [Anaeromyxobacter dehalogenans]ACL66310.1 PKD domain containing protein [Anaeromyxobacter dehalogenans 2CP-1]
MTARGLAWRAALAALATGAAASVAHAANPAGAGAPEPAPMTTANRASGVAPLAVFFDAVDTQQEGPASPFVWRSGVQQPRDPEAAEYVWDFGDAGAGAWRTTGLSRNAATGYTTAHVYETPGVYTATLTVTDAAGARRTYRQRITVSAFAGKTYYVAASGNDRNPGTSPDAPFATFERGFAAVNGGPNRRLLLRRGDSFSTGGVTLTAPGPGIIGAYGEGARPVLKVTTGADGGIIIRAPDWRVMDLDLVGPGANVDRDTAIGYANVIQTVNALVLRVRSTQFRVGFGNGDWKPIYATPHDGNAWVDCEATAEKAGGMYVGGRRLAILGNDLHDLSSTHALRVWQAHKAVIAHNRLWNPGGTRHALKLHGPGHGDGRPETRWVTVTDNLVRGKVWSLAVGPQDGEKDERVSHVVLERNRTHGEASVQVDLLIWARDVMVRNNVFDGTGASKYYTAVLVGRRGIEPDPEGVRVVNNTIVRTDAADAFAVVRLEPGARGVVVRNNLASAPLSRHPTLVQGETIPGLLQDHNLLTTSAAFVDPAREDYRLLPRSPAVDAGAATVEVHADFAGAPRPRGAAPDVGAYESH